MFCAHAKNLREKKGGCSTFENDRSTKLDLKTNKDVPDVVHCENQRVELVYQPGRLIPESGLHQTRLEMADDKLTGQKEGGEFNTRIERGAYPPQRSARKEESLIMSRMYIEKQQKKNRLTGLTKSERHGEIY